MDYWTCIDCGVSHQRGVFPYRVKTSRDGNGIRCAACLTKIGRVLCERCDRWREPSNICTSCKDEVAESLEEAINKMEAKIVIYERALKLIADKKWIISPESFAKGTLNDAKESE